MSVPETPLIGGLCSGYGGLELAVRAVLSGRAAWHSEIDPAACRVLEARFPGVPNIGDMTRADWPSLGPVDVLCGGTPCQDVSHAGGRAGMRAGTRSGLWSAMVDAIDVLRPRLVVWENVRGALSAGADSDVEPCPGCVGDDPEQHALRALGRVLGDLAELGYDARWVGLPASAVGAPHFRFRVFVAAQDANSATRGEWRVAASGQAASGRPWPDAGRRGRAPLTDPDGEGRQQFGRVEPVERDADGRDGTDTAWGAYEPAIRRWEHATGRAAPVPTEPGRTGRRLSPRFVEWMMGLPAGWVTAVPGITRNAQLKMLGNGVVPQQAAAALQHLLGADG